MMYIQVPWVIYCAIYKVLELFGEADKLVWLQMDYHDAENMKPKVFINNEGKLEIDGNDEEVCKIVGFVIEGIYGR